MERRAFLRSLLVGGVVVEEAVRNWPFRVYSFPKEIKIATKEETKVLLDFKDLAWGTWNSTPTYYRLVKRGHPSDSITFKFRD